MNLKVDSGRSRGDILFHRLRFSEDELKLELRASEARGAATATAKLHLAYDKFRTRERFARKVLYQYENKQRARATSISTYYCLTTRVKPRSITKVSLKHNNELNMNHLKRFCAEMAAFFF